MKPTLGKSGFAMGYFSILNWEMLHKGQSGTQALRTGVPCQDQSTVWDLDLRTEAHFWGIVSSRAELWPPPAPLISVGGGGSSLINLRTREGTRAGVLLRLSALEKGTERLRARQSPTNLTNDINTLRFLSACFPSETVDQVSDPSTCLCQGPGSRLCN